MITVACLHYRENTYRTQIHIDGEMVHLKVVDEIGPNEYESVLEHCIKSANGIVICCDVSKKNSIDEIETRIQRIVRAKSLDLQRIPVVIAVTKADIDSSEHETTIDQIREFANSQKIKYVITSARFGTNVNELFETITAMSSDVLLSNPGWVKRLENGEPIAKKEKKKCTLM
jgi:small GTP-binding protein